MGYLIHDIGALLALIIELGEDAPADSAPWVHRAITEGLTHVDAELREAAVTAAACAAGNWIPKLMVFAASEREAWLVRYAQLVVQDLRAAPYA